MKSFRGQLVASTVGIVTAVMLAVVAGTQVVLELAEDAPRMRSSWDILLATGLVGATGVVIAGLVAWRVSYRALRPVRLMAERAEEWSAHDLEQRFDLGASSTELGQLGQTLDGLLDRVARAIRDEQRLSAELAHEIRTPLTAIRGSAELALLRPPGDPALRADLVAIADGSRRLGEVVTTLLDLAQAPGLVQGASEPVAVVSQLAGLVRGPLTLEVRGSGVPVAGPPAVVGRALAPLLENAARHARRRVEVEIVAGNVSVEIAVRDDGPGVDPDLRDDLFDAGVSGDRSSGLGLAIARRAARSLGGDVELVGHEFVLRLPRA